jgi:hypothetical protein
MSGAASPKNRTPVESFDRISRGWKHLRCVGLAPRAPDGVRPMIAYLILVHRFPEQFKRMFRAIGSSQRNI